MKKYRIVFFIALATLFVGCGGGSDSSSSGSSTSSSYNSSTIVSRCDFTGPKLGCLGGLTYDECMNIANQQPSYTFTWTSGRTCSN